MWQIFLGHPKNIQKTIKNKIFSFFNPKKIDWKQKFKIGRISKNQTYISNRQNTPQTLRKGEKIPEK